MQRVVQVNRMSGQLIQSQSSIHKAFIPVVFSYRYGGSTATEAPQPLHKLARFTLEEVAELFQNFKEFTAKESCMVGKEQFAVFLKPLGIQPTPKNVDHYFNRFAHSDGTACLKEFVSTTTTCVEGNQEKLAEIQFHIWDEDQDGKLSREEYLKMLPFANATALGPNQIRSAGSELFYKLDGGSGALTLNDYKKGIYMSQREFGALKLARRKVRSSAGAPLINWAPWDFWDYFAVGTGLSMSFNLFYPW
mmetsp:Transcript_62894/g.94954  ORF Transcript_62894/g.94954 Transcript_62894/m.94954 type:complete len:249 (+) Transcript_62894:2-748(+)